MMYEMNTDLLRPAWRVTFALLGTSLAGSSWSQVPDIPIPVPTVQSTATLPRAGDGQTVGERPASLAFTPDQKPKRADRIIALDDPERLAAALAAIERSKDLKVFMPEGATPLPSRPATLAWIPDELGDIPKQLDANRMTLTRGAK